MFEHCLHFLGGEKLRTQREVRKITKVWNDISSSPVLVVEIHLVSGILQFFLGSIIVSGEHLYFGTTFPKHPRCFYAFPGQKTHTSVRNMASWKISEVNGHLNGKIIYKWWFLQNISIAVLHVTQGLRHASTITTTNILQYYPILYTLISNSYSIISHYQFPQCLQLKSQSIRGYLWKKHEKTISHLLTAVRGVNEKQCEYVPFITSNFFQMEINLSCGKQLNRLNR